MKVKAIYGVDLLKATQIIAAIDVDTVQVDPQIEVATPDLSAELPADVIAEADAGNKMGAIRLLISATGMNLYDAKTRVEKYMQ